MIDNFLSFPMATEFPVGPYDLDGIYLESDGGEKLLLTLKLGFVYDTYRLVIDCSTRLEWQLWIEDSIVFTREECMLAQRPAFSCSNADISFSPIRVRLNTSALSIDANATHLRIYDGHGRENPEIRLRLDNATQLAFAQSSISVEALAANDNAWPSAEWKDWNTM